MNPTDNYFNKSKLVARLKEENPDLDVVTLESMYDKVLGCIERCLREDSDNRVYLPNIGSLYTDVIPENPSKELPIRVRYRLSCKPRKINY